MMMTTTMKKMMMIFVVTGYLHVPLHLYYKVLFCTLPPGPSAEASVWNVRVTLIAALRPSSLCPHAAFTSCVCR